MKKILFIIVFIVSFTSQSQTRIKTMFYNLLNFDESNITIRVQDLDAILRDYNPDLFLVCEIGNEAASDNILNNVLKNINSDFDKVQFETNHSDDNYGDDNNLQQTAFYNTNKLVLGEQSYILTDYRDINHYVFKLNDSKIGTSNEIIIHVFVTHLKSSSGSSNETARLSMAEKFTQELENIPSSHFVIFAGDFNLYSSNEPAYQEILDNTNSIIMKDVLNINNSFQNWHTNPTFISYFTQSTRTSGFSGDNGGAAGGFDDRFDFITISENIIDSSDFYYVPDTYKAFGNNNIPSCFNVEINSTSCSGTDYSDELRNHLYYMSDHLPVVMEFETPETLAINDYYLSSLSFKGSNIISEKIELNINSNLLNSTLQIYNQLGQKVNSVYLAQNSIYNNVITIDVINLNKGIYYLNIENQNLMSPLKFIKL